MTLLAIDTSARRRGLCVIAGADGTLLDHRAFTGHRLDAELPHVLAALVRDDLSAVACVLGPGSYNGLRVGIAAALGLAHARDLPLHGVAALDVVALAAPESATVVEAVADAGRGGLYVAAFERRGDALVGTAPPRRVAVDEWAASPGATAISFGGAAGTLDVDAVAPAALARAAALASRRPPLARTGLEPVYLSGGAAHGREPRV